MLGIEKSMVSLLKKKKKLTVYTDLEKGIYNVLLMRYIGDKYVQVDRVKIKITDKKFRYMEKDFMFNPKLLAFSDQKCNFYAFDYDTCEQLSFNKREFSKDIMITNKEIDIYVNQGILSQLFSGLEKRKEGKGGWILAILFFIIGFAIGALLLYSYGITNPTIQYVTPTPPPTI